MCGRPTNQHTQKKERVRGVAARFRSFSRAIRQPTTPLHAVTSSRRSTRTTHAKRLLSLTRAAVCTQCPQSVSCRVLGRRGRCRRRTLAKNTELLCAKYGLRLHNTTAGVSIVVVVAHTRRAHACVIIRRCLCGVLARLVVSSCAPSSQQLAGACGLSAAVSGAHMEINNILPRTIRC